jgi:hypothetical protein
MRTRLALLTGVTLVALAGAGGANAAGPFLCPIVGAGVVNADSHNGDNGVQAISPAAGTSLLPGNNQAGVNANPNAYNAFGGPTAGNTPGTAGFTPIWNP